MCSANWVRVFPGRDRAGKALLLATMGQNAGGLFVCDVDLASGHCTQYEVALLHADYPTASAMQADTGILYIGSAYTGHLHRFDPNRPEGERGLEDLGPIADPAETRFPCRIDFHPDGTLWIGAYGDCSLTQFDPSNGRFRRFGRMDERDQYFYPWCGRDGTLAGLVRMCRLHVVVVDPESGVHRTVGPTIDVDAVGPEGRHAIDLFRGTDGLLYIRSREGNFRLAGMEAITVDALPDREAPAALPDGTTAEMADAGSATHRAIRLTTAAGQSREIPLDWQGGGTNVYLLHEGPDGRLYGSSILPEHLFVAERDGSGLVDMGQCSESSGEAYSMGNLDGKLYIASYPGARLSVYDPTEPYHFGSEAGHNPRDLGRIDDIAFRPRDMLTGPAGKVWIASVPDYGMWGGTLASFDPRNGSLASHRHVVRDASPISLAHLPGVDRLLVGTSIAGGSGTRERILRTSFVLWDPQADRFDRTPDFGIEGLVGVPALAAAGDDMAYAIVHTRVPRNGRFDETEPGVTELLLLDVRNDRIVSRDRFDEKTGWPLEVCLTRGTDGELYGWTRRGLFAIEPGTARVRMVWTVADESDMVHAPGPILDGRAFFATGHRLRCVDLR